MSENAIRSEIIRRYVGVPFKNQGRTIEGLDCYGLVMMIYADQGFKLFDLDHPYPTKWAVLANVTGKNYLLENYHRQWKEAEHPNFLDLICFNNAEGVGHHVGVYLGDGKFIHTIKAGTVVCSIQGWKDKVRGFYRKK